MLIRHIRVESDGVQLIEFALVTILIVWAKVDIVKLDMIFNMSTDRL